jgi:glycosyltransferase involved in cell wall biosynthesis
MLYADDRRIGDHGIGQFARQVLSGIVYSRVTLETDPDSPLDPIRLSRFLSKLNANDLFFSPGYNPPLSCPAPFLITLHDLNHLDRPENSSALKRLYYVTIVKRACYKAAAVLTVSEFSRRRIAEWSGVGMERIVNVGCGVGPEFRPDVPPYPLSFPYIFCASNRRKHKNEPRLVEAFSQSGVAKEVHLVLTGDPTSELMECIRRAGVLESVHFLGHVPAAQLPSLHRSAQAQVFPSLYEGFGLPAVEAMACGIPVVTSNTTSLLEIAGDAALLVDPTSVEEISAAIRRILHDSTLRSELRAKGLARASLCTSARTAALAHEVMNRAAAGSVQKGH